MPKKGNWGDWAVIGGRHSIEPGVEKEALYHYPKSEVQRQKELTAQIGKKSELPWERSLYDPREGNQTNGMQKYNDPKKQHNDSPSNILRKKALPLLKIGVKPNCKYYIVPNRANSLPFCSQGKMTCELCQSYIFEKGKCSLDKLILGDCKHIELHIKKLRKYYFCSYLKEYIKDEMNQNCVNCPYYCHYYSDVI